MYAIIKTGGKQYQVEEGKVISVEKLIAEQGDEVTFDDVLLVSGEDVKIGKPNVEGACASASYSGSFFSGRGPECHTACGMCCQNTFFNNDGRIDLVHWLYSL